jgi:hypothetical protein
LSSNHISPPASLKFVCPAAISHHQRLSKFTGQLTPQNRKEWVRAFWSRIT